MAIFYYCPFSTQPNGGNKQIYRHVAALAAAGFEAYVLKAIAPGVSWFETDASLAVLESSLLQRLARKTSWRPKPLEWLASTDGPWVSIKRRDGERAACRLKSNDVIVLPEFYGNKLRMPAFGAKLVIFNQNAHYTFRGYSEMDVLDGFPYLEESLLGVLAVSEHNTDYLRYAFPSSRVRLIRNGVNTNLFTSAPVKKHQIAYMPRKLPRDLVHIVQMLRGRGQLEGWDLVAIDGIPEAQVAEVMAESALFLSTCESEGFGLPPLEAASSGCIVVGYTGYAAREFMLPEYCYPVAQGDIHEFAVTLERVLRDYKNSPAALQQRANAHAAFVRERYSAEREAAEVVSVWTDWLGESRRQDRRN